MAQPDHPALIINKDILRLENDRYVIQKKDIVSSVGEVIRIEGYLQKGYDKTNEKFDEETISRIIKSMKPISN
jgi:hypothetical protein